MEIKGVEAVHCSKRENEDTYDSCTIRNRFPSRDTEIDDVGSIDAFGDHQTDSTVTRIGTTILDINYSHMGSFGSCEVRENDRGTAHYLICDEE